MVMSWGNGLYICDRCGDEFDSDELTSVFGGIEIDVLEIASGQYKRIECPYSISLCLGCYRRHVDETAARLLCW